MFSRMAACSHSRIFIALHAWLNQGIKMLGGSGLELLVCGSNISVTSDTAMCIPVSPDDVSEEAAAADEEEGADAEEGADDAEAGAAGSASLGAEAEAPGVAPEEAASPGAWFMAACFMARVQGACGASNILRAEP